MAKVETHAEIVKRWKTEGRTFRMSEVGAEVLRQGRESLRERESAILAADAALPDGDDRLSEIAAQIRDHRAAGHYTTQG